MQVKRALVMTVKKEDRDLTLGQVGSNYDTRCSIIGKISNENPTKCL